MEPVNLRLGIAKRIQERAADPKINIDMDMSIYDGGEKWVQYAIQSLKDGEIAAKATGQLDRLHLWPNHEALSRKSVANAQDAPAGYLKWLRGYWKRVSEWPGKTLPKRPGAANLPHVADLDFGVKTCPHTLLFVPGSGTLIPPWHFRWPGQQTTPGVRMPPS